MKKHRQIYMFFGISTILLTGCFNRIVAPEEIEIITTPMSFKDDIIPIFNQSCNTSGCHNGTINPNLTPVNAFSSLMNGNYVNTSNPRESELLQWMVGNRGLPMPVSGSNSDFNAKVLAWIEQGALNN